VPRLATLPTAIAVTKHAAVKTAGWKQQNSMINSFSHQQERRQQHCTEITTTITKTTKKIS